jgi:hypothetical protein
MTENGSRTGAARDVPPPRPVAPATSAVPVEETGLGRAARAVADAVAGLMGSAAPGQPAGDGPRSAASGLRDVLGAVAGAVGGAFAPGRDGATTTSPAGDRSPGALLGDLLAASAPRLTIRDAGRLREVHPGASDDEIAEALVARAGRLTSAIGAAAGGLSAAHWFLPGSLLALPLELGAETVLLAGVEVVLVGELHELYGRPAAGDAPTRAAAYLASWSEQRSVDRAGSAALGTLLAGAGLRALQRRLTRKLAGAVPSAAPFMLGAMLGGRGNRRATDTLARRLLADLRGPGHAGRDS